MLTKKRFFTLASMLFVAFVAWTAYMYWPTSASEKPHGKKMVTDAELVAGNPLLIVSTLVTNVELTTFDGPHDPGVSTMETVSVIPGTVVYRVLSRSGYSSGCVIIRGVRDIKPGQEVPLRITLRETGKKDLVRSVKVKMSRDARQEITPLVYIGGSIRKIY